MADRSDFDTIAMPHLDSVFRAALALCGRREQAEDLTQTTMLKAFRRFSSFRPNTSCKTWLMRILRNTWIDDLRHQKVVGTVMPFEEGLLAGPQAAEPIVWTNAADVLENFSDEQIIRSLAELPDDHRLTLFLADVEGLSQEEVAEVLGVAVGTVKSRTSRARATLRDKLQAHAEELGLIGRMK
jgi:RNA polymerase sigma-70 factor (ECF subfamily)